MPDVPTMGEAGGPAGLEINSFVSLLAPKGIAKEVQEKIHADVLKVLANPEVKTRYNTFAFEAITWSAEDVRKNADLKGKVYGKLVARKNISLE